MIDKKKTSGQKPGLPESEDQGSESLDDDAALHTGRRRFLTTMVSAATAAAIAPPDSSAAGTKEEPSATRPPDESQLAMEQESPYGYTEEQQERYFVSNPGSDFMVDVIKSLEIDYLAVNPGSSFRGLHESVVNYGGNHKPELLTCLHEEQAGALAHGYAKVAGKPMAIACHGTVGFQHAAMAVYNAWSDRVPILVIGGNHVEATERRNRVLWAHSAQDAALILRDFTKWDDMPMSLRHFAESFVRAYKIAVTPPRGPTVIVLDAHLQESSAGRTKPAVPALSRTVSPLADQDALRRAASLLLSANRPVILVDLLGGSQEAVQRLVELAEILQAPVVDRGSRMNFPTGHHLNQTFQGRGIIKEADTILALELNDLWGTLHSIRDVARHDEERIVPQDAKVISIGTGDLFIKANYQNFQRYYPSDLSISGDAEASLPYLIELIRKAMTRAQRRVAAERGSKWKRQFIETRKMAETQAAGAWSASPVSTARLCMEVWEQIKTRDWALTSSTFNLSYWPQKLWDMNRYYQYIGGSGAAGVGYGAPASVGAALAHREHGRLAVNFQNDGDLMYVPGALWTAAHHNIPLLSIVHNNRAYHQEVMHLHRMEARRQRGNGYSARTGNVFEDPYIDYAAMVAGMGIWTTGPITDANELAPALRRAIEVVESGEPALIDVITQPR